jgi:threonyl-tRNA synthetase
MLVVGEREMEAGTLSVRGRSGANLGTLPIAGLIDLIAGDIAKTAQPLFITEEVPYRS